MRALRILIAQTRTDLLAMALAEAVRREPGLSLCGNGIVAADHIETHLTDVDSRPHVVCIVGEGPNIQAQAATAGTAAPLVLRLDLQEELGHIDFRLLPLQGLIELLRSLASHAVTDAPVLEPGAVLGHVTQWLNAVLRAHLARRTLQPGDVPGFGVSHATIEQAAAGASNTVDAKLAADIDDAAQALRAVLVASEAPLAVLVRRLHLSQLETQLLLLCLAPELEHRYQRIFGYLHDDLSRRAPSLALASALLGEPLAVRQQLAAQPRLQQWKLLRAGDGSAEDMLRVDAPVIAWLLGSAHALTDDPRLEKVLRTTPWPGRGLLTSSADTALTERIADLMARTASRAEWLVCTGEDPAGWRALLEAAAEHGAHSLLRIRLASLLECTLEERAECIARAIRAACLTDAVLVVDHDCDPTNEAASCLHELNHALQSCGRVSFLLTAYPAIATLAFENAACRVLSRQASDVLGRERLLLAAAQQAGLTLQQQDARRIAALYSFDMDGIHRSVQLARAQAGGERAATQSAQAILRACRTIASTRLPHFARRLEPVFGIDDVVLPADRQAQLRELIAQVTYADVVLEAWGFKQQLPYGRGVAALFSGPSGTGKTMAAQAIARQLETDVYIVDLARIVSKYIGETEKNLDAAFNDAERANAVLLFDEADALFGKRSEVKDAHDRYANIEVAYLLQRMESYSGVAILTTNLRQNLDQAFLRRLRFIVEFPKPDAAARERIWRQCLQGNAPRAPDLDLALLARRIDVTGGNIRQITLQAAFAAAAEGAAIGMRHIAAATRAELRKLGRAEINLEAAA